MIYKFVITLFKLIVFCECQIQETFIPDPEVPEINENFKPSIPTHYTYSPIHLTHLAKLERLIYNDLGRYQEQLLERLDIIQRLRWDYEDSVSQVLQNLPDPENTDEWNRAVFLTHHPFLNYRMIRRFSVEFNHLTEHLLNNFETELTGTFESLRGDFEWPTITNLQESTQMLQRLYETYNIDVAQFASGKFPNLETVVQLRAKHCLELAEYALFREDPLTASEWIKAARVKVVELGDQTTSFEEVMFYLGKATEMHGTTWNIDDLPNPDRDVFYEAKNAQKEDYNSKKFNLTLENRLQNFNALCSGEKSQNTNQNQNLHCFYETKKHPYFIINPQQIEIHNLDPEIFEIHGLFGANLPLEISNIASNSLMNAMQYNSPKFNGFPQEISTSPIWIFEFASEFIKTAKRIEQILDLEVGYSEGNFFYIEEPIYLNVFSVGGHYNPCIDCEPWSNEEHRDQAAHRMATVQLILDDVEAGGEMVFTLQGISIKPNKGSAIVFYNSLKNGKPDQRLLRGSCPVLLGSKSVASIFFHQTLNFFNRKCSLKSHE